jgi:FkbM family methyltransferase
VFDILVNMLYAMKPFRGRWRMMRQFFDIDPRARSVYGPELVCSRRNWDFTMEASVTGWQGFALRDAIGALPRNAVFVDIGANVGVFSLAAAAHLRDGAVIAFEPNPRIFADLARNREINGASNLRIYCAAIGGDTRLATLAFGSRHSGGGRIAEPEDEETGESVLMLDGAALGRMLEPLADRFVFLKIDTEGLEVAIVSRLAAAGVLDRVDSAFVEVDADNLARFGAKADELYAIFRQAGFGWKHGPEQGHYDEHFSRLAEPVSGKPQPAATHP